MKRCAYACNLANLKGLLILKRKNALTGVRVNEYLKDTARVTAIAVEETLLQYTAGSFSAREHLLLEGDVYDDVKDVAVGILLGVELAQCRKINSLLFNDIHDGLFTLCGIPLLEKVVQRREDIVEMGGSVIYVRSGDRLAVFVKQHPLLIVNDNLLLGTAEDGLVLAGCGTLLFIA